MVQQMAEQSHEDSITRVLTAANRLQKAVNDLIAFYRALRVNSSGAGFSFEIVVKSGGSIGPENIHQWTLTLDAPEHSGQGMMAKPVADDRAPPRPIMRVEQRRACRRPSPVVTI